MPNDKEEPKEFENTKRDLSQVEDSLIPEAAREDMDGPKIIGGGDPNLSADAGKPMI